jgi:hypothetical protein
MIALSVNEFKQADILIDEWKLQTDKKVTEKVAFIFSGKVATFPRNKEST